jgi:hypothetical protein
LALAVVVRAGAVVVAAGAVVVAAPVALSRVVLLVVVALVRTASSLNLSLSIETAMSCSLRPRNPPTPMTAALTLHPYADKFVISPSFSLASL